MFDNKASSKRILSVGIEGFASGLPLMAISKLLQGWLTSVGISTGVIGLLGLIELPYTFKLLWAPLLDRWTIPWPDRRRGWMSLLQLLIGISLLIFTRLNPSEEANHLTLIGIAALLVAVLSASLDIVLDAYRTDLLKESERGGGAAAATLGYRGAMIFIQAGGFYIGGKYGWDKAFVIAGISMITLAPITLIAPKLRKIENPIPSLREAVIGPTKEFVSRAGRKKALQMLSLVLLYRWSDSLLNLMAVPFLIEEGFSAQVIGTMQGIWGIAATMLGTIVGGIFFGKLGLNRSLWIYGIVGAVSNFAYWLLAEYGGGVRALFVAVGIENFCGGLMVSAFLALLMSLCNPRFSASQYAIFSGVYALSRSVLSAPSGFLVDQTGWSTFFALSIAAAIPSLLLMTIVTPWKESLPRGSFNSRDTI